MEAGQQNNQESDVIQMTELEQVKLENSQLKIAIAQQDVVQAAAARNALCDEIGARVGVPDVKGWFIDIKAGTMTRPKVAAPTPED